MNSNTFFPLLVLGFACLVLGWNLRRSQSFSKLSFLTWFQVLIILLPWLIYFGLFLQGIFINLATLLLFLSISTIAYIWVGGEIRKARANPPDLTSVKTEVAVPKIDSKQIQPDLKQK